MVNIKQNFNNTYFQGLLFKKAEEVEMENLRTYDAAEFAAVHFAENAVAHLLDEAHSANGELTSAHLRLHVRA